ncbi:uncharacterized protein LOC126898614 [Daktulosphaira vitifoliae]|uniref:uncharacterized protein LOC126898614 n=1 Tax=Daktulosphaira vitifoliae TaxID=58002 RepID=UPI0021A9A9A9|nr:uncharacterized protein LOC126898614 [Daktulosphaira vitifoliae]
MLDDSTEEFLLDTFNYSDLNEKLERIKCIVKDTNHNGNKEISINELIISCIEILKSGKLSLELIEKGFNISVSIISDLITYEHAVIISFKHCSESNLIYGDLFECVRPHLTELFQKASDLQTSFFNIIENIKFNMNNKEEIELVLKILNLIWHGAESVYSVSNKVMTANWKIYINILQKFSPYLKKVINNDEPINFLCSKIKENVLSFQSEDEKPMKLSTYMISVLTKICSHGRLLKSYNNLLDILIFLNSYWLLDTQKNVIILKDKMLKFSDQLLLISGDDFIELFHKSCQNILLSNNNKNKISAMYIAIILLKRFLKNPSVQHSCQLISTIFQLINNIEWALCCNNIDLYEQLLINLASVILVTDVDLFERIEEIIINNLLQTQLLPALFASDLWIIIMRYLPQEVSESQFLKLVKLFEELMNLPCFTQCPQHIYVDSLLKRHFNMLTDKRNLASNFPQLNNPNLRTTLGILHVPTLSKKYKFSELVKLLINISNQNKIHHLNDDVGHLWDIIKDDHPASLISALVEVTINSDILLKKVIPKVSKFFNNGHISSDTTETKRYRLRLLRTALPHITSIHEKMVVDIFHEYLFDSHPLVQQWTVETIVYFVSVTGKQNNLITMLFKQPKVRTVITNYLEMKTDEPYSADNFMFYFDQLNKCKFKHKCFHKGQIDKTLDKIKTDIIILKNIMQNATISDDEYAKLKICCNLLNNLCDSNGKNTEDVIYL